MALPLSAPGHLARPLSTALRLAPRRCQREHSRGGCAKKPFEILIRLSENGG